MSASHIDPLADAIAERVARQLAESRPVRILYTLEEVTDVLSCSRDTVRRMMDEGKLRPVFIDSRPRFKVRDVERLVDQCAGK